MYGDWAIWAPSRMASAGHVPFILFVFNAAIRLWLGNDTNLDPTSSMADLARTPPPYEAGGDIPAGEAVDLHSLLWSFLWLDFQDPLLVLGI
ncbi:MAG: hypothetical protein KDC71_24460 [Acidobacteria bacterium]|nr:hypothetical protein [Acidobacteriota bacterium]